MNIQLHSARRYQVHDEGKTYTFYSLETSVGDFEVQADSADQARQFVERYAETDPALPVSERLGLAEQALMHADQEYADLKAA